MNMFAIETIDFPFCFSAIVARVVYIQPVSKRRRPRTADLSSINHRTTKRNRAYYYGNDNVCRRTNEEIGSFAFVKPLFFRGTFFLVAEIYIPV